MKSAARSLATMRWIWFFLSAIFAMAQTWEGHINYAPNGRSQFDPYTVAPNSSLQQWLQIHFSWMVAYAPYFNARTSWFPKAYAYIDLYAIYPGSAKQAAHPDWILRDPSGNALYIPYLCGIGMCPEFAGDLANPAFRTDWINSAKATMTAGNYTGLFVDDVNMQFQVSDGFGNPVAPIDSNTGQPMTYDAWRNYVATFLEQIRAAFPNTPIAENSIWYAGPPGIRDADAAVQRQIATATTVTLERGVADPSLTGGNGNFSVSQFLNYIDRLHKAGKSINFQEHSLDDPGRQYGLAGYFLVSNGNDSIADDRATPDNWWSGYEIDLGDALGPRTYTKGVFERDFTAGTVLLGEPGLPAQSVTLKQPGTTLDGTPVSSVTLSGGQGIIVLTNPPATGVLNAASLAAGPVSPGEIVSVFGSFFSTPSGLSVGGAPATITYAGARQVNAIVSFGLALTSAAEFTLQGSTGTTISVPVAPTTPGIFTLNSTGHGPGAILNQDFSANSATNPAARGSVISVYGTGFGALNPQPADGQIVQDPTPIAGPVSATIGGVHADVTYAGAAPGFIAGLTQINVRVPDGVTPGPSVPIFLNMPLFTTQLGVTVAVQ